MFKPIESHITGAKDRLLTEYKDSTRLSGLVESLVKPLQKIEDTLADMNDLRSVSKAVGYQLDMIGEIVGIHRVTGQSDSAYRLAIYGQIGVNRSTGTMENVIQAFLSYTGATDCIVHEFFPAQLYIQTSFDFGSEQAKLDAEVFMQSVLGVGITFQKFVDTPPTIHFAFEGFQIGNVSAGFGDLYNPATGGYWADGNDPRVPS